MCSKKKITPSLCACPDYFGVVCWQSSRAKYQRHEHSELNPAAGIAIASNRAKLNNSKKKLHRE
jgi:hypothetical protein